MARVPICVYSACFWRLVASSLSFLAVSYFLIDSICFGFDGWPFVKRLCTFLAACCVLEYPG